MPTITTAAIAATLTLQPAIALPAPPDADHRPLLSGPAIEPQTPSIVSKTMTGAFERVEGRPESAALAAVAPDPQTTERAREIALDRTVALSVHLIDEIDTLREMTDATRSGDNEAARDYFNELHRTFDPGLPHDPLTDKLTALLTPEQRQRYTRVLEAYWDAWIDAEINNAQRREDPNARAQKRAELTTRLFQRELRDAYDISIKRTRDAMEAIYNAVDPTDEQREAIRAIIIDHLKRTRLDATPEQRRASMHEIYETLDKERQQKLFGYTLRALVPDEG